MKAGPATFVKVTKVNGIKTKNATAYVFHASGSDPMVNPPLGLPKSVSGAEIKSILGNPNFAANDTQQYPINYIKKTDATIVVDQKTGAPINLPAYTETYYVDASGLGQANIKLGTLSYKQTPENVAAVLDDAAESYGLLSMVGLWIPLVLLILGVIITVIGAIWLSRKKEPKAPAAA
jgi:hypothetical protein